MDWPFAIFFIVGFVMICFIECVVIERREKRYQRIRDTGRQVMATVVAVKQWKNVTFETDLPIAFQDLEIENPFRYQITAIWTNPLNQIIHRVKSDIKVGYCSYQVGDRIPIYISPNGRYVDI